MPFATALPCRPTPPKAALQENTRVFPIGVSRYDNFPDQPVLSATRNALAWLVVALRMGVKSTDNPMLVEEAGDKAKMLARLHATLVEVDMSDEERAGLRDLIADVEGDTAYGWDARQPTYANMVSSFLMGNHLNWARDCRMLVTFSGHGAVVRGRLALCPSDATPNPERPTQVQLTARINAMVEVLLQRSANPRRGAAATYLGEEERASPYTAEERASFKEGVTTLRRMARAAREKGALEELLDVLETPVATMGLMWAPFAAVGMMAFIEGNIRLLPDERRKPPPELGRVITPIHMLLTLGDTAERVTLIVDACQSGGPGESLQGSQVGHTWTALGLRCRIISASSSAQRAAEARIGEYRYSAATLALTQILSRWSRVEDGPAYALTIRNGDLVHRANQILSALAFRQQVSLHAPLPSPGQPSAADLPFCGMQRDTVTVVDPDAESYGIQIASDTAGLTSWQFKQNGTLRAMMLAVGSNAQEWEHTLPNSNPEVKYLYKKNSFYVFTNATDVSALAGQDFELTMASWNGSGTPPDTFTLPINAYGNAPRASMPATGDPAERDYVGDGNPSGVFSFLRSGGTRRVYFRWLAAVGSTPPRLQIVSKAGFPFLPGDFETTTMDFQSEQAPGFSSSSRERLIDLP